MTSTVRLKKGEERRLQAGHLWVFSNEIDVRQTPLKSFQPGELVSVESSRGDLCGFGYINPRSLIAVRLCHKIKGAGELLGHNWLVARLQRALALREAVYDEPWYRLVHGEGDLLPGLVIDRFDSTLVVQITTLGMEQRTEELLAALNDVLNPSTIILNNKAPVRQHEGLDVWQKVVKGVEPELLQVRENNLQYQVSALDGQKTGWFYDHRENRKQLVPYVKDKRVLDAYCYAGAWGVNAAAAGAAAVTFVDASADALEHAAANCALNDIAADTRTLRGNCLEVMQQLASDRERFDTIVLDPPAFVKRKKDFRAGLKHYEQNIKTALSLLESDGMLFMGSCSQPVTSENLIDAIRRTTQRANRHCQVVHLMQQGPDHPVHIAMPETRYLKGVVVRVTD